MAGSGLKVMKTNKWIFFVVLVNAPLLWAQKIAPPPTQVTLPSDTTKMRSAEKQKMDAQKSDLELPEVLVVGTDRMRRDAEGKKGISPDSPQIMQPGSPYEPIFIWFKSQENKPGLQQSNALLNKSGWLQIQGGNFSTVMAEGGYWQRIQKTKLRGYAWLDRTGGEFENSQHAEGGFAADVTVDLAPHISASAHADYNLYSRGLYSGDFRTLGSDWTRTGQNGRFAGEMIYDVNHLSDGKLGFEIGGTQLHSDTSSTLYDETSDFWYRLQGSYLLQWQGLQWTAAADYQRANVKVGSDSAATATNLGNLSLQVLFPLSSKMTVIGGLNFQSAESDSFAHSNRFSPFGRINIMPSNRVGIAAIFQSGYTWPTFSDYWAQNAFIAHRVPLQPQESDAELQITSDLQVTGDLKFRLGVARSWIAQAPYWQRNERDGLIDLHFLSDVQLTELQASIIYEVSPRTHLHASFISYSEKLNSTDRYPSFAALPYRPEYRLPVRLHLQLLEDMHLTLHADLLGKRHSRLNSKQRLPAFAVLQASLTKEFDHFAALVTIKNLLDTDYVIWENYPETGLTAMAGIMAKF